MMKVGWALGAILYEINALPWKLETPVISQSMLLPIIIAVIVGIISPYVYTICYDIYGPGFIIGYFVSIRINRNETSKEFDNNYENESNYDYQLNHQYHNKIVEMSYNNNSNNNTLLTFNNLLAYNHHPYTKITDP